VLPPVVPIWPIRHAPLPGEAFDSWLETYAHRLDISVAEMLIAAGLMPDPMITRRQQLAPNYVVLLHDDEAARLAHATGLASQRLQAMTLARYDEHAVRLHHDQRGVARGMLWGKGDGSRYCPTCLAETGGRWQLRWRLSWTFACTRHQLLLAESCPGCGRQARLRRSRRTVFKPFAAPGLCGNKQDWTACTQDLTTTPVVALPADHPFLHTQTWIDHVLHRIETGDTGNEPAPQAVFNDLRALGCWVLRRAQPGDFARYGPAVEAACHAYLTEHHQRGIPAGVFSPTCTSTTAAALTVAVTIIGSARDRAVPVLTTLLDRGHPWESDMIPLERSRRNDISPHLRALILHARDSNASNRDRLRYRSCTTNPRRPDQAPTHRAAQIPQLLWPQWSLLLKPPNTNDEWFRTATSAALLIPGSTTGDLASATEILSPGHRTPTATNVLNKTAKHWHGNAFLQTICILADHLDQQPAPVDYQRRRHLHYGELLCEPVWHQIAAIHDISNRRLRYRTVRAWLYQRITGNRLTDAPPPFTITDNHDRLNVNNLPRHLHQSLFDALDEHAQHFLQQQGIAEPTTWHPPTSIAPPHIPRPPRVELAHLHTLAARHSTPLGSIAKELGTTLAHIRLLLEDHPPPNSA
jgi:hypothetical protein